MRHLVEHAEQKNGPIDLFCANAGIAILGGVDALDEDWDTSWRINVMAHVFALRALLPGWLARGEGYFLATASAAGLLTNIGTAPYAVTKHAVVALAEWVAITHGDAGVKVACLCPQGVRTPMLAGSGAAANAMLAADAIEPEAVADAVVAGLADGRFLILPHPEVADYERNRANDRDRGCGACAAPTPASRDWTQTADYERFVSNPSAGVAPRRPLLKRHRPTSKATATRPTPTGANGNDPPPSSLPLVAPGMSDGAVNGTHCVTALMTSGVPATSIGTSHAWMSTGSVAARADAGGSTSGQSPRSSSQASVGRVSTRCHPVLPSEASR